MKKNIRYINFSSNRCFGIELELYNSILSGYSSNADFEKCKKSMRDIISTVSQKAIRVSEWEQTIDNNFWHIKNDSTCGPEAHLHKDYGIELASFKGSGIKDIQEIVNVVDLLKSNNYTVTINCGFHVHVEVLDFNAERMGALAARWLRIEPFLKHMIPHRRHSNKYCKFFYSQNKYKNYTGTHEGFWNLIRPTQFHSDGNRQRRCSLNFVNFAAALNVELGGGKSQRKTIELRLPEGTLESEDIISWIKLMVLFVENSQIKTDPTVVLEPVNSLNTFFSIIGLNAENNDDFYILSSGLNKIKIWICKRILTYSSNQSIIKQAENLLKIIDPN